MITAREFSQIFKALTTMGGYRIGRISYIPTQDVLDFLALYAEADPQVTFEGDTWTLKFRSRQGK